MKTYKINYTYSGKAFCITEAESRKEAEYLFYSGGLEEEETEVDNFEIVGVKEITENK